MLETTEKGYVMVPRQLIHDIIRECPEAAGEQEAFLRVLLYANYKESVYRRNGVEYVCARGESLFSYLQWAEILGWSRGRTMRFFKRMFACERLVHLDDGLSTHIRIPDYDVRISRAAKKEPASGTPSDNGFKAFWEQTGTITTGDLEVVEVVPCGTMSDEKIREAMNEITFAFNDVNPTQQALMNYFEKTQKWQTTDLIPFSSARKYRAIAFGDHGAYVLGAPEFIMKNDEELLKKSETYALQGYRVLLLAETDQISSADGTVGTPKPAALIVISDCV